MKEVLEAGAQVVEARLAVGRQNKPVLGTLAMTGEAHVALPAETRQRIAFVKAELDLLRRGHQLDHVRVPDVAQQIVRLHEVIARIQIAVVLDGQPRAAGGVEDAHAGIGQTQPVAQRRLEGLHVDRSYIATHPLVKDCAQEAAKLLRLHRAIGDGRPLLEESQAIGVDALHDGDELHPGRAHFVAQETVDFQRVVAVDAVDGGQHIVVHTMLLQKPQPAHDLVEGWLASLVYAVHVVQRPRPIDADAQQEVVFGKEGGPFIIQQRAVGLHRVQEGHARPPVLLHQLHGAPVEVQPHQRRLAALPGDVDAFRLV